MGLRVDFGENIRYTRWYPWTGRFEVVCIRLGHRAHSCRFTKYNSESSGLGNNYNPAAGRPLGLVSAWLLAEDFWGLPHEHSNPFFIMSLDRPCRLRARDHLSTLADGDMLQAFERSQRTGEPIEPFGHP